MALKTINSILKECDNTDSLTVIIDSWKYICRNKYSYPIAHIEYAKEHLVQLAAKMGRNDAKDLKGITSLINNV